MELQRYEMINQYVDFLRDLSTANFWDVLTFNWEKIKYVSDEIVESDFMFWDEYTAIKVTYITDFDTKDSQTDFSIILVPNFILKENNKNEYKVTNNNEE